MPRIRETRRYLAERRFLTMVTVTMLAFATGTSASRVAATAGQAQDPAQTDIAPSALAQIDALMREKASRTAVQQKIDSQLVYAIKMRRGEPIAAGVQALDSGLAYAPVRVTDEPRLVVDVTADVTDALLRQLQALGAQVIDATAATAGQRGLRLSVTTEQIEPVASLPGVIFVQPKQEAMTSRQTGPVGPPSRIDDRSTRTARVATRFDPDALASFVASAVNEQEQGTNFTVGQGSKASEGEFTHRAFAARGVFHTSGAGIKIGVLSDGVRNLATSQALGDLGDVTVIGNPAPCPLTTSCDEGTAMLEIVHDLAPGAQSVFRERIHQPH